MHSNSRSGLSLSSIHSFTLNYSYFLNSLLIIEQSLYSFRCIGFVVLSLMLSLLFGYVAIRCAYIPVDAMAICIFMSIRGLAGFGPRRVTKARMSN